MKNQVKHKTKKVMIIVLVSLLAVFMTSSQFKGLRRMTKFTNRMEYSQVSFDKRQPAL